MEDAEAVARFQELLRFPSVSGEGVANGSYRKCADWIVRQVTAIGLTVQELEPVKGKPIVIATLLGSEPSLGSIVLNSHYDVVPTMRDQWSCDPFGAEIREGYSPAAIAKAAGTAAAAASGPCVYGRGAQDMKCVVVQYIEALRRLRATGWEPRRTLHLTFVPDEEIGGTDGMCKFLESPQYREMQPIALALDEGLASQEDSYTVFYGERAQWWLTVRAEGPTGERVQRFKPTHAVDACQPPRASRSRVSDAAPCCTMLRIRTPPVLNPRAAQATARASLRTRQSRS